MSTEEKSQNDRQYYTVFSGAFRTKVPEGHPDAIERVNKLGKQVFEKEVKALFGFIEDVAFEKSDYGKQLKITLDANEEGRKPVLTFGVESKDGRDILKKLPAVDSSKEVRIMPYRFKPEDKPDEISGVSVFQRDEEDKFTVKIENFFYDPVDKKYLHDFPVIDWEKSNESEQKIYKIQRDEFLVKYVEENVIGRFNVPVSAKKPEAEQGDFDPSSIPF